MVGKRRLCARVGVGGPPRAAMPAGRSGGALSPSVPRGRVAGGRRSGCTAGHSHTVVGESLGGERRVGAARTGRAPPYTSPEPRRRTRHPPAAISPQGAASLRSSPSPSIP